MALQRVPELGFLDFSIGCMPQQSRRTHSKSRGGCVQCRARRVKCDELKPSCKRCIKSTRGCTYRSLYVWLYPPANERDSRVHRLRDATIPPHVSENLEWRSVQLFLEKVVPSISSHYYQWARTFWIVLVPRMMHETHAVEYAVQATTTLYEGLDPDSDTCDAQLFYKQYNNALRAIIHPEQTVTDSTALISCVLFCTCATLQGNITEYRHHARAGLAIIEQARARHSNATDTTLAVYRCVAKLLKGSLFELESYTEPEAKPYYSPPMPQNIQETSIPAIGPVLFLDFQHAFTNLKNIVADLLLLMRGDVVLSDLNITVPIRSRLKQWETAFTALSNAEQLESIESECATLLNVHHLLATIVATTLPHVLETQFDCCLSEFDRIVTQIEALVKAVQPPRNLVDLESDEICHEIGSGAQQQPPPGTTTSVHASVDDEQEVFGYIAPLFFTATRCRDPIVRRRAIRVLRDLRLVEREFCSQLAANIAERVVDCEEEGLLPSSHIDIPDSARMRLESAVLSNLGGMGLSFREIPYHTPTTVNDEKKGPWFKWARCSEWIAPPQHTEVEHDCAGH